MKTKFINFLHTEEVKEYFYTMLTELGTTLALVIFLDYVNK